MKLNNVAVRAGVVALFAIVGATSAMAQASADPGYATYKRVVLGDSSIEAPQAQQSETRLVPGPYARHLIYLGEDRSEAIAHARAAVGEQATLEAVASSEKPLKGAQLYRARFGSGSPIAPAKTQTAAD